MRKVFKPESVVKSEKKVMIPDIKFKREVIPSENSGSDSKVLTNEVYQKIKEELREEYLGDFGRQKLMAAHECDILLHKAKKEAKQIIDEATKDRKNIIDEANATAEEIRNNAYEEGKRKGLDEKSELLENLSHHISYSLEQIKHEEEEYFAEYEKQLKYVAVEICEKIIHQKIDDDDMTMYNLIKNAIKSVRNSAWIKAEVSEKMLGYADSLEKELSESGINAEILTVEDAEEDNCVISTDNGLIVATVSKQLENLRDFINRQDKDDNDEEVS